MVDGLGVVPKSLSDLVTRFAAGDVRALARAISLVERQDPEVAPLLAALSRTNPRRSSVVGITGAPGVGKSTMVDALVHSVRRDGRTVGVLAVDPSSPFSGGALLGDRARMGSHSLDPGVFVRSMGSRGHSGGLSLAAGEAVWLLGAFGFGEVMLETVGAGQSEFEVRSVVDTTVVVLTPGMGDALQLQKAGMMEIADVFAVNKADLPGASTVVRELRLMLNMGRRGAWRPPIVPMVANRPGDPAHGEFWEAIAAHREHLEQTPEGRSETERRLARAAAALVASDARAWALGEIASDPELAGELGDHRLPFLVAERLRRTMGHRIA